MTRWQSVRACGVILIGGMALGLIESRQAAGDNLLSDDFSNAIVRTAADNYGIGTVYSSANWVAVNAAAGAPPNGALSISAGRMYFSPYDDGVSVAGSLQGVAAKFTPKTLSNVGDTITLKFDFGFTAQPNTSTSSGGALGGFRFGLYNDAGTALLDNNGNQDVDDYGYRVGISVISSPSGSRIAREGGTDASAAIGSGTDNAYFSNNGGALPSAVGTSTHTAQMAITKTVTSANLRFTYDGALQWLMTDATSPPYLSFNEIGIVQNAIYSGTPAIPPNGRFFIDNLTVDFALPTVRGDASGDGLVNFSDLSTVLVNYNAPGTYAQGDFDASGTVDFSDLSQVLVNYNQAVATAAFGAPPVPEPGSLLLFGIGALALLCKASRRLCLGPAK